MREGIAQCEEEVSPCSRFTSAAPAAAAGNTSVVKSRKWKEVVSLNWKKAFISRREAERLVPIAEGCSLFPLKSLYCV